MIRRPYSLSYGHYNDRANHICWMVLIAIMRFYPVYCCVLVLRFRSGRLQNVVRHRVIKIPHIFIDKAISYNDNFSTSRALPFGTDITSQRDSLIALTVCRKRCLFFFGLCPSYNANKALLLLRLSWGKDDTYRGADKSLARPGRKQVAATENCDFYISYL
jgi:hypothetical protein